ncbi:MAG: C4-dicarboxylate TRAP transporter substrate-binding protein [Termitinemataceae bacterium]|jgi:TRAP-type C4-dicarboxylate transport system substrate-binding protein|nr:MAG: C4-dicarboxylate TRAP transporter substrate-binding protein [Termitinemataceae bacterium]
MKNTKKLNASLLAFCMLCAGLVLVTACAKKGGKGFTLKMSTQLNDTSPMVDGFKEWAKAVETRSEGRLKIQVFTSASLGSDEDVIEQALQGVNVAVLTDGGRMANYVKDIGIIGMAYIADNYEDLLKITKTPTFASWDAELVKNGMRILSYNWYDGPRNFYTNKVINSPADLQGLRIRTPGAPVWARSVASLGATPVAMPWPESYNALQSQSIDGVEVQSTSAYPARMYEVVTNMARTEHFQLANFIMVGEKWYSTLPDDLKTILSEECVKASVENAQKILSVAADFEKQMAEKGIKINEVDKAPFRAASEAAYAELGFLELRNKIRAEVESQ